ncbi:MAG: D-aminoacylase [Candidatus Sungbacteria bacterium]|uniref:D-aminoacylase n=1 Tax=Candidatus Sungiibacteriota bacterium TaxID=2750080 RepID=A0A932YYM0_9BACT|nr:D-aminoacylase [Candidatus Sungbacteria bacterium]
MTYDILIKGGTIIDGTGRPRFQGDVGIADGRVKDIGNSNLAGAKAGKTIEARGKFVTPGFVDITNHADKNWSLFQNPLQDYLLTQGVTTILAGNCGSSLAPLPSREAIGALYKWNPPGFTINWLTVREFLEELAKRKLGVNIGTLVGHSTIRRGVTKGEARTLTKEELQQFTSVLANAIQEGAFGFSTGLVYSHESPATTDELISFARVLADAGAIYKTHLRHEGTNLVPAVIEAVDIGRESRATVVISHFKAVGRKLWPFFKKSLQIVERASAEGFSLHFDISPYQRTGSFLYLLLPAWAREGGFPGMFQRLQDPKSRNAIIEDIRAQTLHYDRYIVANAATPGTNGRTIAEIASSSKTSPEETIFSLLAANHGRVTIFGRILTLKNLTAGIAHPLSMIASDGSGISAELVKTGKLVHPRSTGAFPHFLHKFVKEKELLTWEDAIRKITSRPAEVVGFKERGRLEKKYRADIVVFDPETIRDQSTYQNPFVHSNGIDAVVVNGKLAVENGQLTGVAAGVVLKKD